MKSISIAGHGYKAEISLRGGGLQGLWLNGQAVTTSYVEFDDRIGAEGDVLAPFPGRINKGRYHFDGQDYELALNERSGEHAIHGFVRMLTWDVVAQSETDVSIAVETQPVDGYPFRIQLGLHYALTANGLAVTASAKNLSDVCAPFAIGYHSYFVAGDAFVDTCTLTVPFERVLEFDALIPTGNIFDVADAEVDFKQPRVIGSQVIDNCFVSPSGPTPVVRLSGQALEIDVWMDAAAYPNCVLFTGDTLVDGRKRRALAIEPMSCTSDGFNHPEWGLTRLSSGDVWVGKWGVSARTLDGSGS
jgi:aldose 1-epimerase